jgi:hypothetical protein
MSSNGSRHRRKTVDDQSGMVYSALVGKKDNSNYPLPQRSFRIIPPLPSLQYISPTSQLPTDLRASSRTIVDRIETWYAMLVVEILRLV